MKMVMEIIKQHVLNLGDSNLVIEFRDESWIRIAKKNDKFTWYNSINPHQTIYFQNEAECYKVLELSIKDYNVSQVVLNSPQSGNLIVFPIKTELNEIAEFMISLKK